MPFDMQGARAAGYSDAEIASFLGKQVGFDTDAAVKAGYKPAEVVDFLSQRQSEPDAQPLGDASGAGDFSSIASQPTGAPGSVLNGYTPQPSDTDARVIGPSAAVQQVDPEKNREAYNRTRVTNPQLADNSVMFQPGRDLQAADDSIARNDANQAKTLQVAQRSSGSTAQDVALNLLGGAASTTAKAGAALAQATGADEVERSLDAASDYWRKVQADNGGATMPGKVASVVGSIAPALLVDSLLPAAAAYQLVSNAGLFAIPAFRDTLKEKIDAGQDFPLALAHASQAFGLNIVAPSVLANTTGKLAKGAVSSIAVGTGEGAAFSAANSVLDKSADLAYGQKNDNDWLNFQDMAVNAIGFGAIKGAHVVSGAVQAGASAVRDRMGTPSEQVGRALGQDVDSAQFTSADTAAAKAAGFTANPNLARAEVVPPSGAAASVSNVLGAGSIDDAIAAADAAARSAGGDAVRDEMLAIRPLQAPTLEQELAALRRPEGATDDSAGADLPAVVAGADRSGVPEPAAGVGARAGGADEPANAVAAQPVVAGAESEPVPPRDADAVTRGVADAAAREAQIAALPTSEVEAKAAQITMRRNDSGTVAVLGDPGAVGALLRAHDVPFIPSREGALVGRTNADAAEQVVSDFAPSARAPETADAGQGAASSVEPLPEAKPAERFPRVDAIESMAVGPSSVRVRPIAPGQRLYRETNAAGLDDMLRSDRQFDVGRTFVADNPDIALGQGENKGVTIQFRPDSLSGMENRKPGTGDVAGREYVADIRAARAVERVTFAKPETELKTRGLTRRVLKQEFDRERLPDGRIEYTRKGLDVPPAADELATAGSERAADANPDQGPLFKRGSDTASGITEATFHDQMARAFGDKVAQRLIDKGVVVPIPDQSKLPDHVVPFVKDGDTIFGFYDPKTDRTYAVLSNLKPEMVKPLALHEVGVHYGFENMLGRDKYNQVINRIAVMGRAGHQAVIEAKAQAKENSAHAGQVPEETLAYLVTNHPEMSLVREVIARIKAFLFDKFGIGGKYLTTDDITALARAAVLHSSRGEAGARAPEFAPQFSRSSADASDLPEEVRKPIGAYHAYDNLERVPRESSGGIADSIAKALVPAGREGAIETGGIVRANLAEQARGREMAQQKLMEFAKRFDAMPVKDNYAFIDAMERGIPQKNAELDRAAVALRKALDERRDQVRALGKGALENFNQNYFPHIWKDKTSASNFFTRRPLEGGKGFLKQRTYDYFSDGLKAGLEPITTNPVELALLKAREMDRYIYGQRIFAEMKQAGVAKFVRFGDKAPEGWQKINDKIARVTQYSEAEKGMVLRGEYYAPEQAATLINNNLSPGLSGVAAFDMIRRSGNIMNATQLGLSAFHLGFTTLDAMISKAALGIKQATRGDIVKGTGNVLQSLNPAQPFLNLFKGDRLLKAYMGNINDPDLAPIVEALVQGGGRVKMDDVYRNAAVNEFRQAIRKGQYATAALKSIPRALDLINAPIFQWLVPRQKLGVFFDMAKDALEKNPEMSLQEKRQVMGKLWDSVDNRMGELVYDNVFWNRALKDALMVSVRSVGWNLGTFREIGGGIKDIKDIPKLGGLSDRTAYIFGLTFVTAVIGSLTQYMLTGEPPKELKDVFFPRTGKTRPDGTEDRISLPSYIKDIYEYGHDIRNFAKYGDNPFNTLGNKLHPLISTLVQIFTNKDFFGGAIRSPGDSSGVGKLLSGKLPTTTADWQQELDEADYLVKQMTPFSYRNYMQQTQLKGEEPSIAGYLSSPSMIGITPSPGYITKTDEQAESSQVNKMRESLVTKFREEMRDGAEWPEVRQRAMDAGLRGQDLTFIHKAAEQRPPKRLKEFANH